MSELPAKSDHVIDSAELEENIPVATKKIRISERQVK